MQDTKQHPQRLDVERHEEWHKVDIPELEFPAGWKVKLVPPFAGAMARMVITNQHDAKVSVYFDAHGALGAMDQPYWETYPVGGTLYPHEGEDTSRYLCGEEAQMLADIAKIGDPVRGAAITLGMSPEDYDETIEGGAQS
jgi:hypothetical protein